MKFKLICIGKTTESFVLQGIEEFEKRLQHYINYQRTELVMKSKGSVDYMKSEEGKKLLDELKNSDYVILLDEKGKAMTSQVFSQFVSQRMQEARDVIFIVGGAFGFSNDIYSRADAKIALSAMTFPHQLVRILFTEQMYRACTIFRGEKYHH